VELRLSWPLGWMCCRDARSHEGIRSSFGRGGARGERSTLERGESHREADSGLDLERAYCGKTWNSALRGFRGAVNQICRYRGVNETSE
jgi:hypothetical protein